MKINVERFTGGRKVMELEEGATKGATVGENLYYNGVLVLWEDIYNGPASGASTVGVSAWSLLLDIPPNVTALANTSTTGIYVVTGAGTSATRDIVSADGSVTITNPGGVAGDIDLSAAVPILESNRITADGNFRVTTTSALRVTAP